MSSSRTFADVSTSCKSVCKKVLKDTNQSMPASSTLPICSKRWRTEKHSKFDEFETRYSLSRSCSNIRESKIDQRKSMDNDDTRHPRDNSCSRVQPISKPQTAVHDNKCRAGLHKKWSLGNSPTTSKSFETDGPSGNRKRSGDNDKPYLELSDLHKIAARVSDIAAFYKDDGNCKHTKHHSELSANKTMKSVKCQTVEGRDTGKKEFCGKAYPQSGAKMFAGFESLAHKDSGVVLTSERFPSMISANGYIRPKRFSKANIDSKDLKSLQTNDMTKESNISRNSNDLPIQKHNEANKARQQNSVDAQKLKATQAKSPTQGRTSPDLVVLWNSTKNIASKESMEPSFAADLRTVSICDEKPFCSDSEASGVTALLVPLDHHSEASDMRNHGSQKLGSRSSKHHHRSESDMMERSIEIANKVTNDLRINHELMNKYVKPLLRNISDREKRGCKEMENNSSMTISCDDNIKSSSCICTDEVGDVVAPASATVCVSRESDSGNCESESSEGKRIINSFKLAKRLTCQTFSRPNCMSPDKMKSEVISEHPESASECSRISRIEATVKQDKKACNIKKSNVTFITGVDKSKVPPSAVKVCNVESKKAQTPDKLSHQMTFDADPRTETRESFREEETLIPVHGYYDNSRSSAPTDAYEDHESIASIETSCSELNRLQDKIINEEIEAKITKVSTEDEGLEELQGSGLKYCNAEMAFTTQSEKHLLPPVTYSRNPTSKGLLTKNEIVAGSTRQFPDIETTDYRSTEAGLTGNPKKFSEMRSAVDGWIAAQDALEIQYLLDSQALTIEYFGATNDRKREADSVKQSQLGGRPSGIGKSTENANVFLSNRYQNRCRRSHTTPEILNTPGKIKVNRLQQQNQKANAKHIIITGYMFDIPPPDLVESSEQSAHPSAK